MARFSAFLDACVLVPVVQADTLLRLAEAGIYRPLWSSDVLAEMVRAIETIHPMLPAGRARRRASLMDDAFEDASVQGWEALVAGIELPDPNDRHVLAAAQRGRADLIVTNNTKDFPPATLASFDIEVQTPDEFLLNQLDLDPQRTMNVLQEQARATRNPAMDVATLLERLGRCGAVDFASEAGRQLWRITS